MLPIMDEINVTVNASLFYFIFIDIVYAAAMQSLLYSVFTRRHYSIVLKMLKSTASTAQCLYISELVYANYCPFQFWRMGGLAYKSSH